MFVLLKSRHYALRLTCTLLVGSLVPFVTDGTVGHGGLRVNETPVETKSTEVNDSQNSQRNRNQFYVCPPNNLACVNDPFGYEAIHLLHAQIDDDRNGDVDRDESNEFLRDDLKLHDEFTLRTDLHGSDDLISVHDLWRLWSNSDVYKWTVSDVIDWLTVQVQLPQYAVSFRINDIDGRLLPRLTTFSSNSLLSVIGIKNPVHRQKLALKAADAVLFGPPKNVPSIVKDLALISSLFVAVFGCYVAYSQHRRSECHLQKVMRDMKALQKAEVLLSQLQHRLKKAQTDHQVVTTAKHDIEQKLNQEIERAKTEAGRLRMQRGAAAKEQISCLKLAEDELAQLRKALCETERQLQTRTSFISGDLQQWLQLTYEVETNYFEAKRAETEQQLKEAREMCDKIRRQKGKLLGSFQVAHTNSLDVADDKIICVRRALEDVKKDLQERSCRWKEIENVCGFNIIINPGIPYLNSFLHRSRSISCSGQAFQNLKRQTSFMGIDNRYEEGHGSYLHPSYTDQQVLSNLMRAGMQLSVVGVNLSEINSSRAPFQDSNPSPVSLPLHQCKSTSSLSSIGSFISLQPFGQQCVFSLTATSLSRSTAPPLTTRTSGVIAAKDKSPNGNSFLCHGRDEIKTLSNNSRSSLETKGQGRERLLESDTEQNVALA